MSITQRPFRIFVAAIVLIVAATGAFAAKWDFGLGIFATGEGSGLNTILENPARRAATTVNGYAALPPLVGTFNIPGDYPDLAAAITDLNTQGVGTGGVVFNLLAGNPQTAPAGGYVIGGTGSAVLTTAGPTSVIIFNGGGNTITANGALTSGALNDGIFKIIGADWVTLNGFSMQENPANTTTAAGTNNMTEWGVALLYVSATDGSQNITIVNNTIDLDRTYQNTFGIYANATHSATSVTTSATATGPTGGNHNLIINANTVQDVNNGIVVVGPTAAADQNDNVIIGAFGFANQVLNYGTTGTFSGYANVSGTVNGILVRNSKNFTVAYNTVTSSNGGVTVGTLNGIQIPAFSNAPTGTFTNSVNNNILSVRSGLATGAINGINVLGTSASTTSTININNNDFNTFGHTVAGSGVITFISQGGTHLIQNILNNTFTNMTVNTTGNVTFISNSQTLPTTGVKNVNNNSIVTGFSKTGAGGTVLGFTDNGSDPAGTTNNVNNNTFTNILLTGPTAFTGIANTNGGAPNKTVSGNTISGISGATATFIGLSINFDGGNTIVNGNTISGVNNGGTTTGILFGTSGAGTTNASQNTIHTLTATGTGLVTGVAVGGTTGTIRNVFRNKIYNLENNNAGGGASGLTVSSGATINVQNNLVGDIRTPALNAANSLFGINISGGTTVTADFNTVYLNAASTGANFGSSAINASSTPAFTMRDNILVNTSTAAGTGLTAAYRRSSTTLTTYAAASNNNDFYAGTPGAANVIFTDGTNSDQTIAAYRARVAARDSASISENPNFVSTSGANANFLHINTATPTQLESGGISVAGITLDFDGDTRNVSTPDIGADEFAGTPLDLTPPNINYTAFLNTTLTTNRALSATITDASGVAGGATSPRIYFRKNGGTYFSSQCTGTYSCTVDYSLVGGVVVGDVINYFVIAQDNVGNVGANPGGGLVATDVNTVTTPPTTPNSYTIITAFPSSVNVGAGETYTSLSNNDAAGLFLAINGGVLTGSVTVNITSDLTAETGAVALNQFIEEGAGGYTLTIKPSGAPRVISGSSTTAIIRLNDADRVTIDGSTSGGTAAGQVGGDPSLRNLTIQNTSTTATAGAVVAIGSSTNGAQNNTVRNVNISGQDPTQTLIGIHIGGASPGSAGTDNDNNRVENCSVRKTFIGLYNAGASAANQNTGNVATMNDMTGSGVNRLRRAGMLFFNHDGLQVTLNSIGGITDDESTDAYGIGVGIQAYDTTTTASGAITNSVVSRNRIDGIASTNTTGFSSIGIGVSGGPTGANTISNNMISGVTAPSTSPDIVAGVYVAGATGSSTKLYFNSVSMTGDRGSVANQIGSFGIAVTGTDPALELKDNIFYTTQTSGGGATAKSYAVGMVTTTFVNLDSNFNDFVSTGANAGGFRTGGLGATATDLANLAAWQAAVSDDANSLSADPLFVSTSDLHLQTGSPAGNAGTTVAGITTDIDGNPRFSPPEIGADEYPDTEAPDTAINTFPPNPSTSASAAFTFSGTDTGGSGVASFECQLDAGGYAACTSPKNYAGLAQGAHTFNVRAIDAAGNTDPTPAIYTWVIDAIAPDTQITSNPPNPSSSANATFTFTGTDSLMGSPLTFECKLDAAAFAACTSPKTYTALADGSHTFQVRAIDGIGNVDQTPASYTWVIDTTVPDTQITSNPPDPSSSADATFTFTGTDSAIATVASFECKLDVGAFAACTSPKTYTALADGAHTFQVRAIDGAGNIDPTPASYTWTINSTPSGPVTVTATAGTTGPTNYATLKDAVDAVNAGIHQGDITISIVSSTTETTSIVLNSSGAAPASYTSVVIRPVTDGVTVAGPTVTGRGLIELNGADNVTIDGDNPNTTGTNRNLTVQNTAANTVTFTSVIRIALATAVVTSADNCTFKNLNILGSGTGRNVGTATTTTGTENNTYGILATGGASTVSATTAPSPIASLTTTIGTGATAANLVVDNVSVGTAARAVAVQGSATTVFPGVSVTNNSIGNATAGAADQVYFMGVTVQGSTNAIIRGNTVYVESHVPDGQRGLDFGGISAAGSGAIFENNSVLRVRNNRTTTFGAYGINIVGGTGHTVQNNFIAGLSNDQTAGTAAFSTTFGVMGIRVAGGTGHKIYHNSVHLTGVIPGATSTDLTMAFAITLTSVTGVDVRNNIFSNQLTGGNPTGTSVRHVNVFLPSAATSAMSLTWNNNAYYQGSDPKSRMAQVGITAGTGEFLAANFDPTQTTPATNFRAYTSTLSAAGTNDNASFASVTPPPFTSNVNLHIPAAAATRLESGGAAVGVLTDIDAETRNATTPDIGADEFAGLPPFANDIAAVTLVTPANGATLPVGQAFSPQATFNNNGTATQTNVTVRYRIIDPSTAVIYNQTASIPSIAPLQNVVVTFASTSLPGAGTHTIEASAELSGDQNTGNDLISGSVNGVPPLGGSINVGTGETYTSLTNAGGIFQALNTSGISGNVVINVTSDLTAETGAVALNQLTEVGAGGYTVTIKPSGAARTISGTSAASSGLIILNGADRIIFDGSLSGGTDRSLTITNNQATTGIVIWMRSPNASNGATNNTVKNCVINGAPGPNSTTVAGVLTGSSVTLGGDAEAPNSNNTIQNNWIYRVQNSLYLRGGTVAANFDQNWVVSGNELGSATPNDKNIFRGMLIGNSRNFMVAGNFVHGVQSTGTTTAAMSGIQLALLVDTGLIANNIISDIKNVSASGTGAFGMQIGTTSTASNVTIANNFISDVATNGLATVNSNGFGMMFNGSGTGYNVYFNSVNMNTNQTAGTTSAAINVNSTFATAGALNVRNNIFANTQTTGTRYAVYSTAAAAVFAATDYNDYFAQNVGFIGGSARVTLADWQTATGQDVNSKAVDPLFVSTTNLHIQSGSPMAAAAVAGTGITTDIDGEVRGTPPDIGADEIATVPVPGTLQFSNATYSGGEAGSPFTVTVTRASGSDGTVTVQYATSNGTATGGASCSAGVDYVNNSGTLTFANGVLSQTFDVVICNDTTDEPDETINYTLSNPTGGATLGTPSTAVQTIVDDDLPLGTISINDVRVTEGNSGTVNATFTLTHTGTNIPASVQYTTANGTAAAGSDYGAATGTVTFDTPVTIQNGIPTQIRTVMVVVNGDILKEANETFFVNLSNPTNATISDSQGVGIIVDEDRAYTADFDRDLASDFSVFRPGEGNWYVSRSSNGAPSIVPLGTTGDVAVPGDYDGDGSADYAVWKPTTGAWTIRLSSNSSQIAANWGVNGDKAVQGDYDGDGKTDLAVYRPSTGTWWILRSSNGTFFTVSFGISTDRPVQGDYDGDAKTDIALYRDGTWYILRSSDGSVQIASFGLASDKPVSGDFDGDGKYDLAIYRNGEWWILNSLTATVRSLPWGTGSDIPVPADYDRDGTTDIAVFRPSTGVWYVIRSSNSSSFGFTWGQNGDVPIPAAYLPQ